MDGLCRALEAAGRWDELIVALESRATLSTDGGASRADRVRIAKIYAEIKRDPHSAIAAWRRVRELHGRDEENFGALSALLESEQLFVELAELVEDQVFHEPSPGRQRELYALLGALHEERTARPREALEAYVAAGDWGRAVRVTGARYRDPELGRAIAERLLELAVASWQASGDATGDAARTADWALNELGQRLLEAGLYETVVERLLEAAKLPFATLRRREHRREAACLARRSARRGGAAIELFQGLLDENPVTRSRPPASRAARALLEEKGARPTSSSSGSVRLRRERALKTPRRGCAPGLARPSSRSSVCGDLARAIAGRTSGAPSSAVRLLEALLADSPLEARLAAAAKALEALCAASRPECSEARSPAVRSAVAAGHPDRPAEPSSARCHAPSRLVSSERGCASSIATHAITRRWPWLRSPRRPSSTIDRRAQLEHLRQAALLHVEKRNRCGVGRAAARARGRARSR